MTTINGTGVSTREEGAGGELDADGGLGVEVERVAGEAGEDVVLVDAGRRSRCPPSAPCVSVAARRCGSCTNHAALDLSAAIVLGRAQRMEWGRRGEAEDWPSPRSRSWLAATVGVGGVVAEVMGI